MRESLHSNKLLKEKKKADSAQQFLDIKQIKDGVVVLNNGSLRAVLMVSSINFDLKSLEEQDAIIASYQNFLNSLDFPVQIFISSRKINLKNYIESLKVLSREQTNELLHLQMEDYILYISSLVSKTNIVNKTFYIVVPFSPIETRKAGILNKMYSLFAPKKAVNAVQKSEFEVYKNQLWQRVEHIQYGLNGAGIRMVTLNTQELIELYYSLYNPSPIERLRMGRVEEMAINSTLFK